MNCRHTRGLFAIEQTAPWLPDNLCPWQQDSLRTVPGGAGPDPAPRSRPDTMMLAKRISAIISIALAAGCASVGGAPSNTTAQPLVVDPSLLRALPVAATDPPASAVVETTPTAAPAEAIPPAAAAEAQRAPLQPASAPAADRVARPPARPPAKASAPVIAQTHKSEAPAPSARTPEPPLDVAALKARLRDTPAIGVFTKLALRNQMDDLLQRFRTHHLGGQKTGVAHLRQPYDLLVLKVLAVVQDGDPSLARTISGSREAIWIILADPEQFKSVT